MNINLTTEAGSHKKWKKLVEIQRNSKLAKQQESINKNWMAWKNAI